MKKNTSYIIILFLLGLLGFASQYLLNIYLAHRLSLEIFGEYSLAMKTMELIVCLTLFGTDVGSVCYLSKYLLANNEATIQDYIAWNIKLVGLNVLILRILVWILFLGMLGLQLSGHNTMKDYPLIVFVLWVTPFAVSCKLLNSFLLSYNIVFSALFLNNVLIYLIEFLFFIGIFELLHHHPAFVLLAIILAGAYSIVSIISSAKLTKEARHFIYMGFKQLRTTSLRSHDWFPKSGKIILNSIIFLFICSLDLFIIRFFSPNYHDVSYYAAVLSITSILGLVPKNLYQKIKPTMAFELTTPSGRMELQKKLNDTNKIVFIIMTLLAAGIIVFSIPLLMLFGAHYTHAHTALIILTIGTWYTGLNQISGVILLYADFEELALNLALFELFLIFLFTVPATYFYGINGTATATALVYMINGVICSITVKRKLGIQNMIIPGYIKTTVPPLQ